MDEHPGYEKHKSKPADNSCNGFSNKVLKTNIGDIPLDIPGDRESSFDPIIVPHRLHNQLRNRLISKQFFVSLQNS
jgi:transposase-like protein